MNDAKAFADGIAALLATDATFSAAITALLGAAITTVLRSNLPTNQIPAGQYPCFVIEQGDGRAESTSNNDEYQTIGLAMSSYASDLHVSLIWSDNDRANAASARAQLPTLFAQLLMRNPQPGGIDGAVLSSWMPDRGVNHPTQIWSATITGNYTITRA